MSSAERPGEAERARLRRKGATQDAKPGEAVRGTADEIRVDHQSQDRLAAWASQLSVRPLPRGRGDPLRPGKLTDRLLALDTAVAYHGPFIDHTRGNGFCSFVAPRPPVEELLAGIWAEVLELERVGVHDDFFDLGGHSLKATQVMARLRYAFQVGLPLRSLFETPTVARLALAIEQSQV